MLEQKRKGIQKQNHKWKKEKRENNNHLHNRLALPLAKNLRVEKVKAIILLGHEVVMHHKKEMQNKFQKRNSNKKLNLLAQKGREKKVKKL